MPTTIHAEKQQVRLLVFTFIAYAWCDRQFLLKQKRGSSVSSSAQQKADLEVASIDIFAPQEVLATNGRCFIF